MRLLHAADLHLDSPMTGLAAYDGAPVDDLRLATRAALGHLVDLAIEEAVDVVLLAGDLFDGDWPHYGTGVHAVREMGRLREAGIPVVSIAGNHDAESRITRTLRWPDNVHVLDTRRPETCRFDDLGLAVHGQGYPTPAVTEDLSARYPPPLPGMRNVGLLHTSADGRPGHERYAPCSVARLRAHGYDYWALGHIHRAEVLASDPPVVFPGNLQGRGLRETGPKGAVLVTFEADGRGSLDPRVLDVVRWERIQVDVAGCSALDDTCERVAAAVRVAVRAAEGRLLAARVVLTGTTEAHGRLLADAERLRFEVVGAAADVAGDRVWIQGVELATSSPRAVAAGGHDAVGELLRELEDIRGDEAAMRELAAVLGPLADALPTAVRDEFDPADLVVVRALLADVERALPVALLDRAEA